MKTLLFRLITSCLGDPLQKSEPRTAWLIPPLTSAVENPPWLVGNMRVCADIWGLEIKPCRRRKLAFSQQLLLSRFGFDLSEAGAF